MGLVAGILHRHISLSVRCIYCMCVYVCEFPGGVFFLFFGRAVESGGEEVIVCSTRYSPSREYVIIPHFF